MFINNLRISVRYLLKNRTFSFINVFGLMLGFTCFILIALFIQDELTFDMFHSDADQIYRVIQHEGKDGKVRDVAAVAARIGPEAAKQFPEVADAIRISALGRITMGNDPANRGFERITIADPNFFGFFDFELVDGDVNTALSTPEGIVLSEKVAKRYFGDQPALGKRIWTSDQEFTITGVMKDPPLNSHIRIEVLFAEATFANLDWYKNFVVSDWRSNNFITYLKLRPNADPTSLGQKMTALIKENYPADREFNSTYTLQPLADIHLYSENIQGTEINTAGIKPFYIYIFGAVAVMIVLIACLNYMNLSTAAAYKRTREIGTRKTLGAQKLQLVSQFTGEAVLLAAMALLMAIALVQVFLPSINQFLGKNLSLVTVPAGLVAALLGAMILAGVLSSLYPSFIVARVSPAEALKREIRIGNRALPLRKMLVVVQFTVSIMMIASTIIIYRQLQFMKNKELGFNLNDLLVIDINSDPLRRNFENVKARFKSVPEVQSISTSTRVPGEWKSFPIATTRAAGAPAESEMIFVGIDDDFLQTYDIKLIAGRNFSGDKSDSLKVILTELAAGQLGLKNPVGQVIEIPIVRNGSNIRTLQTPHRAEVIGIAENFHFESFRQKMMPVVFGYPNTQIQRIDYYTMRIETTDWQTTIEKLKQVNNSLTPDDPLEYTFLDGRFEEFYKADEQRGQVFMVFSMAIVFIACLGLFALVSYSIESRTKEIGIRKVLGASVQNIVNMISKEFLVLIIIAGVIAAPITIYLMKGWLQDFAYHITMGADIFALAAIIATVIALATISFRSIRAAIMNPVKSLRSE